MDNDSTTHEWVPMSWLSDGRFIGDDLPGNRQVSSGADIPQLEKLYTELHGPTL